MENVFENACFGKAYLTRDGRKAIYMGSNCDSHLAVIEGTPYIWEYSDDGTLDEIHACSNDRTMDIVSEWRDEIDDDKFASEVFFKGVKIVPPERFLIGNVTETEMGISVEFVKDEKRKNTR